ncbi:DUF6801 domain-containing protein [Actinokineospora sp. G85]|uniref:DUF6801 domain-containing protein n=1 Tax=Actinokineospora sp. G85 TaxID=3406626 RepID=UPI003C7815A0
MRSRRSVAALAAAITAAGVVAVAVSGSATAAETVRVERGYSLPCIFHEVDYLPTEASIEALLDVPASGVLGRRSAPVAWQASGVVNLPEQASAAFAQAGATSVAARFTQHLIVDEARDGVSTITFSGETALTPGPLRVSGSGEIPGLLPTRAGEQVTAIKPAQFTVLLTPRKADGSPTAYGSFQVGCGSLTELEDWHRYDVVPAPTSAKHLVAASTRIAGGGTDLGVGGLAIREDHTGAVTGSLSLPRTGTATPPAYGFLPTTAKVLLTPGPITGRTAPATVTVPDLSILGMPLLKGATTCKSTTTLSFAADGGFTVGGGGTLIATYDLPAFTGCGSHDRLVTELFSRTGNTLTITTI